MIEKSQARQDEPSEKMATRITVSLPANDYEHVCVLAAIKKVSASWIVRDAVDRYLQDEIPLLPSSQG
jgi:hypothetical protein